MKTQKTATKTCCKCKVEKDASHFYKRKESSDGLHSQCKECYGSFNRERLKRHYQKHKERYRIKHKEYWINNREELLAKQKVKIQQNPRFKFERGLSCKLKRDTKLSIDELYDYYNEQFAKQNGRCVICGRHESELETRFHIDHNHKTKKLRGLLCSACNIAIGFLQDDAELCLKAYDYLRKH